MMPAPSRRVSGFLSLEAFRDPVSTPAYMVFRYLSNRHDMSYETFVACRTGSIQHANRLLAVYQLSVPETAWRVALEVIHDLPGPGPGPTDRRHAVQPPEIFLRRCVAVARATAGCRPPLRRRDFYHVFVSANPDSVRMVGVTEHYDSI
jgi:hypothetical protein